MWQIETPLVVVMPLESMYRRTGVLRPEPEQLPDRSPRRTGRTHKVGAWAGGRSKIP